MTSLSAIIENYWESVKQPSLEEIRRFEHDYRCQTKRERIWYDMIEVDGCVTCDTLPKTLHEDRKFGHWVLATCEHCEQRYMISPFGHMVQPIGRGVGYRRIRLCERG